MPLFSKQIIAHPSLYIVAFTQAKNSSYLLFVHGGPGFNSGVLEYLIEHEGIFDSLEFNIILYDQRGCGRSKSVDTPVLHEDNVGDLESVYKVLTQEFHYNIAAIAGHSYGAKVLFDYLQLTRENIPSIFIAIAPSMLTPRMNNLLLDLSYLKSVDREQYQNILEEFSDFSSQTLWHLSERLAKVFQENKNRPFFYWANLEWQEKVKVIQDKIALLVNSEVFTNVRKDLYSKPEECSVDIDTISKAPCLWINGLHDLVMDGASALTKKSSTTTLFFKSAHYPHIEEHDKFCDEVNAFLKENLV